MTNLACVKGQYSGYLAAFPWNHIPGHSPCIDKIYSYAAQVLPDGAKVVEIGVMYGRSLAILMACTAAVGKTFDITGVDLWQGPPSFNECSDWLKLAGLRDGIKLMQGDSLEIAKDYADDSLDLVFIDGDHSFEGCSADIRAWLPKVKIGGYLAGHDYESTYPGVIAAVHLAFPGFLHHVEETGICWLVRRA